MVGRLVSMSKCEKRENIYFNMIKYNRVFGL